LCFHALSNNQAHYSRSRSKLLELSGVAVQSGFQLTERSSLYLVCVLQLSNPLCFFSLKTGNFTFDLHALFVFLIDSANQLLALLETLLLFFHSTHLQRFILLVPDCLFHSLSLKFFGTLLDLYHLFVLLTFLFQSLCLTVVLFSLTHLLIFNSLLLVVAVLSVSLGEFSFFLFALSS
jgi:hypothetical protein